MRFASLRGEISHGFEPDAIMRLLITRPRDDCEAVAAELRLRGHEAVIAPLLKLHFTSGETIDLSGVQGLLATSANGIRGFVQRSDERNLPVYAVGPQTAKEARSAGFGDVVSADGDSEALAATVHRMAQPGRGKLLHIAGAETAGGLAQSLGSRGFVVETVILYEAVPVDLLPEEASSLLARNLLDGVLLYSPRTGQVFSALMKQSGLVSCCENLTAFCISAATAAAISALPFKRIAVAASPNQTAMFDLLEECK